MIVELSHEDMKKLGELTQRENIEVHIDKDKIIIKKHGEIQNDT